MAASREFHLMLTFLPETPIYSTSYVTYSRNQRIDVTNFYPTRYRGAVPRSLGFCNSSIAARIQSPRSIRQINCYHGGWNGILGSSQMSKPHHSRSKSSSSSLYLAIVRLSLEVSTQVTKSSMCRVTRNAGSVIVSGPTLTWPCSTNFTAALTVSAIFDTTMMTGSRRRQKAATSFDISCPSIFARKGS